MLETVCNISAFIAFPLSFLLLFSPGAIMAAAEKGEKLYGLVCSVVFYLMILDCAALGTFLTTLILK